MTQRKVFSRRQLAAYTAGSALAVSALAQTQPAPQPAAAGGDLLQAARDSNRRIGEALGKIAIPIATEPAFQFKA